MSKAAASRSKRSNGKAGRRNGREDVVLSACRSLLGTALKGDPDAAAELSRVPAEAWPDTTMRETAGAIIELTADGAALELPILFDRLVRAEVSPGDAAALTEAEPTCDPWRLATLICDDHRECRARRFAAEYGAQRMTWEEFRACVGDLDEVQGPAVLTLSDIADAGPMPSPIFECGVYRGKYSTLQAVSNAGKTFVILQLGVSVALGESLLNAFVPHRAGRVLLATGEDDGPALKPRLRSIAKAHDIPYDSIDAALRDGRLDFWCGARILATFERDGIRPSKWFTALRRHIETERYDLVVIDPENSYFAYSDSNAQAQKSAVAGLLMDLAGCSDAAVLVTQHTSKGGKGQLDQVAAGGSLALANHARFVLNLVVMDEPTAARYDVAAQDRTRYLEVAVTKNSYRPLGDSFFLERVDGGALVDVSLKTSRLERIAAILVDHLRDCPEEFTERELVTRNAGKPIRDAVKDAMDSNITRRDFQAAIAYALNPDRGFATLRLRGEGSFGKQILEVIPS